MSAAVSVSLPDVDSQARSLGISREAVELTRTAEVIDLHIDTFIPPRLYRYDLHKRHGHGLLGGRFFGHLDFRRILEGGLSGAMWSITTNPYRRAASRWRVFQRNVARFKDLIASTDGAFRITPTYPEYRAARAAGAHAVIPVIQGGNALQAAPDGVASIPDDMISRITLVHLTNSAYGITSSPLKGWKGKRGLSDAGRDLIRQMNARRVFVDLAHINEAGFWDAVEVHDRSQPLIATHTGVDGVRKHWRNLDDRQIKAIADTGGTIGIIFSKAFLARRGGPRDGRMIIEHMAHVIDVAGEDFVSVGSDYDGAIVPPGELRSGDAFPRLVQHMLDQGWSPERVTKVLGGNFLRAFEALRPG